MGQAKSKESWGLAKKTHFSTKEISHIRQSLQVASLRKKKPVNETNITEDIFKEVTKSLFFFWPVVFFSFLPNSNSIPHYYTKYLYKCTCLYIIVYIHLHLSTCLSMSIHTYQFLYFYAYLCTDTHSKDSKEMCTLCIIQRRHIFKTALWCI
ncbi:hypothetical protein BDF14DRAFT_1175595 [Spinellus fusiger]|nr:hypothetical protein BDF14DRAFT_1175595 [Spinellus fusiger]